MKVRTAGAPASVATVLGQIADELEASVGGMVAPTDDLPLWTPLEPMPGRELVLPDGRAVSRQRAAYESLADELAYGGAAGSAKSDLLLGLALTAHRHSVIFRRERAQCEGIGSLWERSKELVGLRGEPNESRLRWKGLPGGRRLEFAGVQHEKDWRKQQGKPHDLKAFDEVTQIPESAYRMLSAWARTKLAGQRVRVVVTFNPPTRDEERWVLRYWGPWLDPKHPHPARDGELRWYTTLDGRTDVEVPDDRPIVQGPDSCRHVTAPVELMRCPGCGGTIIRPRSRTCITASLEDNPHYLRTGYAATLQALPEPHRSQMLGSFTAGVRDDEKQCIPTEWVLAAQARWAPDGGRGKALTSVGVDPALGGADEFAIAKNFQGWIAPLVVHEGRKARTGAAGAALVYAAVGSTDVPVCIDIGGAAGPTVWEHCRHLNMLAIDLNGSRATTAKDRSGRLGFRNDRARLYWNVREVLDPDQPGGSTVALPPDDQLRADLCATRWFVTPHGIQMEEKEAVKKRIGRSPDRGEAVIYALAPDAVLRVAHAPEPVGTGRSYWGVLAPA